MYKWQQKDLTNFKYNVAEIEHLLFDFAERTGLHQKHFGKTSMPRFNPIQNLLFLSGIAEYIECS